MQDAYDAVSEDELSNLIRQVETANENNSHGQSWRLINAITGRKSAKRGTLKGTSREDRMGQWHNHFSQLLGSNPIVEGDPNEDIPAVLHNLNIRSDPFTLDEYLEVKKKLTLGKSPRPDGIPPEVFKLCDFDNITLSFANKLLQGDKPDQWSTNNIIPLPKSGDLSVCANYRGIALSVVAAKITNKMILNRIQPEIDKYLRPNQNGFRPGRTTTAHILVLRRLIEGIRSHNLHAVITFVDFRKAFDSIHRGKMLKILKAYGIPDILINAISKLYENTRAKILTPDGETELFDIIAGVLQGDTLAPFLFAIVLDYAMRQAIGDDHHKLGFELEKRKSSRYPPNAITDLDFADDIALLSGEIDQAQELLSRVEFEAAKVGLHLNTAKTELMQFNHNTPVNITTRDGAPIKVVNNFKYLGAWMESTEKDFQVRKAVAWSACHKLRKIWNSSLSRKIKVRLFTATVETVLLYGCETWTVSKSLEKRLNGCYTRMLRMALNISWSKKLTNEQLYEDIPPVSNKVAERRMRLSGHCIRHPDEEIASSLVLWQPSRGRASRGRPAVNYVDVLKRDTDLEEIAEIRTAMQDRVQWRKRTRLVRARARPR